MSARSAPVRAVGTARPAGRRPPLRSGLAVAVAASACLPWVVAAVASADDEQIGFHRPESWGMAYVASETIPTALGVIQERPPWESAAGIELVYLPRLSAADSRIGFDGTTQEDLDRSPLLARVRFELTLPAEVKAMIGWIPPVRIEGIAADLATLALEHALIEHGGWTLGLRAYGEYGLIAGDITCTPDQAGQPPGSAGNPLGCLGPSHDRFLIALAGIELQGGLSWWAGGPATYLGFAVNAMHLRFAVDALETTGEDRTTLYTHGQTVSGTLGIAIPVLPCLRIAGELFYSPLSAERQSGLSHDGLVNGRLLAEFAF